MISAPQNRLLVDLFFAHRRSNEPGHTNSSVNLPSQAPFNKARWVGGRQAGFTRLPGNRINLPIPYLFSVVHFMG